MFKKIDIYVVLVQNHYSIYDDNEILYRMVSI